MLRVRNSNVSSAVVVTAKKMIGLKSVAVAFLSTKAGKSKFFTPSTFFAFYDRSAKISFRFILIPTTTVL